MQTPPNQLILHFESREDWRRNIARGVLEHVRAITSWEPVLITEPDVLRERMSDPQQTRHWVGIIGAFYEGEADIILRGRGLNLPIVNVTSWQPPEGVDWVRADNQVIGETAARYFLDRGYRHFAYLGLEAWPTSAMRLEGFQNILKKEGHPQVHVFDEGEDPDELRAWLKTLPRPCALMACNDMHARFLFSHLNPAEISVPDHLAVLGVDNDDLLCTLCKIPLSSIRPDWEEVGRRAAMALDRRVSGATPQSAVHMEQLSACSVVTRRSTDAYAVEDDLVQRMMTMVRNDLRSPPTVQTLARRLGVSSRTLSRHARSTLGKSVKQVILHTQLEQAHDLVVNGNLPIGEIAWLCGFNKQSRFNAAFRERYGITPTGLRHRPKRTTE
jgi:LacI family transcriptional regulator